MRIDSFKITPEQPVSRGSHPDRLTALLVRLHTLALRLYPAAFRTTFADEMTDVFAMTIRHANSLAALCMIVLRELAGLPIAVWQVRRQAFAQLPPTLQRLRHIQTAVRIVAALLGIFLLSTLQAVFSPAYNLYALAVPFAVALLLATVSLLISVLWGRVGGILTFLSGVAIGCCMTLYIYIMGVEQLGLVMVVFIGLLWALPFLIFGSLFYQLSYRTHQTASP
ncbi:MAG: hypothetical protein LCI00_27660 [Chloroflexi bacterium]|nr:hypothetical protein [Chloroflexota bacterium]MCC6897268.1 hypothetical protein [Anaerolineae bacterium]